MAHRGNGANDVVLNDNVLKYAKSFIFSFFLFTAFTFFMRGGKK